MNTIGYLTAFDSTVLFGGAPPYKAKSLVQNTSTALVKTYVLSNGTKINYDGTDDSDTTPGKVSQVIYCPSGGATLYATLAAKLGYYGAITLYKLATGTLSANGILEEVRDVTPNPVHGTAHMEILVTFDLLSVWS